VRELLILVVQAQVEHLSWLGLSITPSLARIETGAKRRRKMVNESSISVRSYAA